MSVEGEVLVEDLVVAVAEEADLDEVVEVWAVAVGVVELLVSMGRANIHKEGDDDDGFLVCFIYTEITKGLPIRLFLFLIFSTVGNG